MHSKFFSYLYSEKLCTTTRKNAILNTSVQNMILCTCTPVTILCISTPNAILHTIFFIFFFHSEKFCTPLDKKLTISTRAVTILAYGYGHSDSERWRRGRNEKINYTFWCERVAIENAGGSITIFWQQCSRTRHAKKAVLCILTSVAVQPPPPKGKLNQIR